jgi:hypothetical protein
VPLDPAAAASDFIHQYHLLSLLLATSFVGVIATVKKICACIRVAIVAGLNGLLELQVGCYTFRKKWAENRLRFERAMASRRSLPDN